MSTTDSLLKEAMALPPLQKAKFIDKLLSSLDHPDREIDELWAREAEQRIDAYDQGRIKALTIKEVIEKYR
jgi:putative addiction module component (TIGR02574 family)